MSVAMSKADGVTVLTLTGDPESSWPPLCPILRGLCYNPACCSVSRHLRRVVGTSQSVLGALHIMVGLLNVGLGAVLMCIWPVSGWHLDSRAFPYWLGALFILFGIVCILSERFPSPCLVLVNAILNFLGIGFAIAGIVLYAMNTYADYIWGLRPDECYHAAYYAGNCAGNYAGDYDGDYDGGYAYSRRITATPNPAVKAYSGRCMEGRGLAYRLILAIDGVAIALCALEVCLVLSSCVLAIKSLCCRGKSEHHDQQQSHDEPDGRYKSRLEEVGAQNTHPCLPRSAPSYV